MLGRRVGRPPGAPSPRWRHRSDQPRLIGAIPRAGLVFGGVLGRRPWLISGFQCKSA